MPDNQLARGIQSKSVPVTGGGGGGPKAPPPNTIFNLEGTKKMLLMTRWKYVSEDCRKKCTIFFPYFLRIFQNICRFQVWTKTEQKLKNFVEKSNSQKLKILLNEKNMKIVVVYVSEQCTSFGIKNSIWPFLRGGWVLHVVLQEIPVQPLTGNQSNAELN